MLEDSSSKLQQKNHRGFQSSLDFSSPLCSAVDYFSRNGKRSDHTSFIHPHPPIVHALLERKVLYGLQAGNNSCHSVQAPYMQTLEGLC